MADTHKTDKDPEKTVDLPPYGSRNPDPITDAPGSHPIETGIGAAIGGAASGAAIGAATGVATGGPVGAVVGGIVGGAVLGGLAGKGVGELIDPTTEDNWLREYFRGEKARPVDATEETYRPAYRYGLDAGARYPGKPWDEIEPGLRAGWAASCGTCTLTWDQARGAVRHAYDRTCRPRAEQLQTGPTGSVNVPTEHEEVVTDQRPQGGTTAAGQTDNRG
jgi:hypothetical protein